MSDTNPKGTPWREKLKVWWSLPFVLFFLGWIANNTFDFWDRVIVPSWRWFSPSYSAEIAIRPSLINLDQATTLSVDIKRNDVAWHNLALCTWLINDRPITKNRCETWNYTPNPNDIPQGIKKSIYKLAVSVSSIDGSGQVETEPKTLIIRGINTPRLQAKATNLFLGENTTLLLVTNGLPSGITPTCTWNATVGTIVASDSNSCSAQYIAPAVLSGDNVVERIEITTTVAIGSLTGIQSGAVTINVSVPEENVFQYVVEASRRMTHSNENGTILFDVARQQIRDNIDQLKKNTSGYGGIQIAGGSTALIACQHLSDALLPLGPLDGVTYENLAPNLDAVDLSGDGVPLLSAWRKVVGEFHRFKAGHQLNNPRYFLITLVTGGDTCEGEDPVTQLQQLGLTIEKNELRELLFQDRLITLTIATDSNAWWEALT